MLVSPRGSIDASVLASFLEIRASLDEQMTTLAAERRTRADLTAMRPPSESRSKSRSSSLLSLQSIQSDTAGVNPHS